MGLSVCVSLQSNSLFLNVYMCLFLIVHMRGSICCTGFHRFRFNVLLVDVCAGMVMSCSNVARAQSSLVNI